MKKKIIYQKLMEKKKKIIYKKFHLVENFRRKHPEKKTIIVKRQKLNFVLGKLLNPRVLGI